MTANELLLWMSARGHGSWSQFRAAIEELHITEQENAPPAVEGEESAERVSLPLHQSLRLNLQRLAHVEFFAGADGDDWRVTPPSLSVTHHGARSLAVMTGARSDALLRRLHSAPGQFEIETVPLEACPDQIRLVANDAPPFSAVADHTGLLISDGCPSINIDQPSPYRSPSRTKTGRPALWYRLANRAIFNDNLELEGSDAGRCTRDRCRAFPLFTSLQKQCSALLRWRGVSNSGTGRKILRSPATPKKDP